MRRNDLAGAVEPTALVERLTEQASELASQGEHHHGPMESVREATYRGHHIVIRTSFTIEVDGRPLEGHLGVTNDGQVHYHAVPNLGFASAVDLVERLIDTFPDDFPDDTEQHQHDDTKQHQHDDSETHEHGQG